MELLKNEKEAEKFRLESTKVMKRGRFSLAKWESKIANINDDKEKVKTRLLGIEWNKGNDTYIVEMNVNERQFVTKRMILQALASIYDTLGIISPILIEGKNIYRQAVDEKRGYDQEISEEVKEKWNRWLKGLRSVEVPRTIVPYLEDVTQIVLHHFMDASSRAISAQTVGIVTQPTGVTQELLASKSRLAKRGLSIARLGLVACQMGANMASNTNSGRTKDWGTIVLLCGRQYG